MDNNQYLNRQFYGIPPVSTPQQNNEYNDLNQSIGEEMRQKYPYSVAQTPIGNVYSAAQTPMQTPSYPHAPPTNTMPPPSMTRPLTGISAPPTGMMNAPPTGMMNAPPTGMNAPPTGMMNAPPTGMMNAPPTVMTNAPPTGMNAPPISYNAPPTSYNAPPTSYNGPPTGINGPPTGMMNAPPSNLQYNSNIYQSHATPLSAQTPNTDNFQSVHIQNLFNQNPITTVHSTSMDTYDEGLIPHSTSNDSQQVHANTINNPVQVTTSYDSVDKNAQSFFESPTEKDAKSFFGSMDKEEVFPAKVVKPRSLIKPKIEPKVQAEPEKIAAPPAFPPIKEIETVNVDFVQVEQQQYQQQQYQQYETSQPHQAQYQVPASDTNTAASPMQYKYLDESFASPEKQNISDVSFSNPQTPVNTSAMSPMTPGSTTRFIENRFGDLASLIESRRSELDALRKKNFASYSAITGSSTQKPTPFSPPPASTATNNVKSDDSSKLEYSKLESDIKLWTSKYEEEKKKADERGLQLNELEQQLEDYKNRIESMQSIESSNNQYLDEEIKMWSSKYEEERKHAGTLELQLREMSNQLDDYDRKFQELRTAGSDTTQLELIELQAQIEELNLERDDLQDEMDTLRSQLLTQTAKVHELSAQVSKLPPDDSANNEYINNLKSEIEQLKLSVATPNTNSGIDAENLIKENVDLRFQLEELHRKLEATERSANAIVASDDIWPQEREEFIKQWTIQATEWNTMREQLEKDKNGYYEIGRAWEAESLRFKAVADEREVELIQCKKKIDELNEKKIPVSLPASTGISQEEFQKKIKQIEMDMAQKWMSLLIKRKKSFLLRRSFDIMRQLSAKKPKVNAINSVTQAPPTGSSFPSSIPPPPISTVPNYPTNPPSPSQELRRRKTNVTAEEEKQLQSDFSMIKQLQRSDNTVVIDRQNNIYQLMSSIFYKSIIWLLLIIIAFLYIKSCSIGISSRPVRLTS